MAYRFTITVFVCFLYLPASNQSADLMHHPKISERIYEEVSKTAEKVEQKSQAKAEGHLATIEKCEEKRSENYMRILNCHMKILDKHK